MGRRKKQPSHLEQAIWRWLERQPPDGWFARMACSTAVSFVLQEKHRGWYYATVAGLLVSLLLPLLVFGAALGLLGYREFSGFPDVPLYVIGMFSAFLSGIGTFGLYLVPIEALCRRLLQKDYPQGFPVPFFPGWPFTLFFLGGLGGLSALCLLGIHYL